MRKKKPTNQLPFKYDLAHLFSLDDKSEFSPALLFLAYFGELPSDYSLRRFNMEHINRWIIDHYKYEIIKTIKHELFFVGGTKHYYGVIYVFKSQILIKLEENKTTIFYADTSEDLANKLVKELLKFEWNAENRLPNNYLHDNFD